MGVYNENNKFKKERLCKREEGLYVSNKTTLIGPIKLNKIRS